MYSAPLHQKDPTMPTTPRPPHPCVHHFAHLDIYLFTMRCRGGIIRLILIQRLECNYILASNPPRRIGYKFRLQKAATSHTDLTMAVFGAVWGHRDGGDNAKETGWDR